MSERPMSERAGETACQHTTLVARDEGTYECKWCAEVFTLVIGGGVTGEELRRLIEHRNVQQIKEDFGG